MTQIDIDYLKNNDFIISIKSVKIEMDNCIINVKFINKINDEYDLIIKHNKQIKNKKNFTKYLKYVCDIFHKYFKINNVKILNIITIDSLDTSILYDVLFLKIFNNVEKFVINNCYYVELNFKIDNLKCFPKLENLSIFNIDDKLLKLNSDMIKNLNLKTFNIINMELTIKLNDFNIFPSLTKIIYIPYCYTSTDGWVDKEQISKLIEEFKKLKNDKIQLDKLIHKDLDYLAVGCTVKNSGPTLFKIGCTNTDSIYINFNNIEKFTKLKTLYLKGVYITSDNYEQLYKSNIEKIIIDTCISDDDFKFISNIKTLKSVIFDNIEFNNIDNISNLFELQLEELIINFCNISSVNEINNYILQINKYLCNKLNNISQENTPFEPSSNNELNKYFREIIDNKLEKNEYYFYSNNNFYNTCKNMLGYKDGDLFFESMNNCKTLKKVGLNNLVVDCDICYKINSKYLTNIRLDTVLDENYKFYT